MNADPSFPMLTTEQIQKCLEENKELILAILEGHNQGRFGEMAPYQARLQHNLTFLAKLADVGPQAGPQAQTDSQGQGMQQQQQPQVAMSQQRRDFSSVNPAFDMNEQQQQQQQQLHFAMSLQQPDLSTSKLGFQKNEQQHYKQPNFFQQHQLFPEGVNNFTGSNNSGMQTRLFNLPDTPFNQMGSDVSPGWS